jgi:phospholipid transport system substrate-binding protein
MLTRTITIMMLFALLGGSGLCLAQEQAPDPMAYAKKQINEALNILRTRNKEDQEAMKKSRQQLHKILSESFDMPEISTRALARNKAKFKPEEFTEFNELFTRLLFETYLNSLETYSKEEVVFVSRKDLAPGTVTIATEVVRADTKIPIDYTMHLVKQKWTIYDVQVEGVSLSKNYRTQFREILMNKPPKHLIELLQKKVATLEKKEKDEK